jgi:exodeoxyribonuclease V gamma subunit
VLSALAAGRDVHLFLLHPSPALWTEVAAATAGAPRVTRRAEDPTTGLARHPLLASWGRDAREMQLVLRADEGPPPVGRRDEAPTTLLRRLQAEIRADRPPPGLPLPGRPDGRPVLDPGDRSLQVHACHGRARQVEVVRDAVLHALAEDPTLEPRDVIVMCPDIETFAPLVHATFGAAEAGLEEGAPDLRVRLADRSLRQTNPVLGVVSELIELASARVTASQVLDLAGREPVRRRFRLDDDDLVRIEEWVAAAGVRWGLDAGHREPFRLESVAANTWRAGLDRVLVGVAMAEEGERLVSGVLPLDDVESGAIDLVGRLAELLERLDLALEALRHPQPIEGWVRAIAAAADALTATGDDEAWQRGQLDAVLEQVRAEAEPEAGARGSAVVLALPEVRALLADRLRGRPTRANFRTGHLTVCTLVPMRSVPHRVVCLLGLDDGAFPRQVERDGDDIILADPHVGDRDARGEDRQLLLDALFAASDRLVVTYTGRDERTNAERTPAVPIGELLDVVDRTVRTDEAGADGARLPARERVLVRHPLQPFDPRNFTPGALLPGGPWSFDPVAMDGARALIGPRAGPRPFLAGPLAPAPDDAVEVERLVRFAQHPARAFLRRRLGVTLVEGADDAEDALPVELDALERWGVGDRLLRARLAGADPEAAVAAERARGLLPPGALAGPVLEGATAMVDRLAAAALDLGGSGDATSVEVDVRLRMRGGERRLVGSVPELRGGLLRTATYSRVGPKHRLAAWVRLLAVAVARPGEPVEAVTIGRGRSGSLVCVARLFAPDADEAREHLAALVDLHDRGMREPLPLYCKTSAAYAEAVAGGGDPARAAASEWESRYQFAGECAEPEHLLVLGGEAALVDLLAAPPGPDDDGAGWEMAEASRLGRYARRLWDGLLAHEEVVER